MKTLKLVSLTLLLALAAMPAFAQVNTYYVSPAASSPAGDDTRSAATAQNPATPWKTCAHAIATFTLNTQGAVVVFLKGDYLNESCNINRGGSSSSIRLVLKSQGVTLTAGSVNNARNINFTMNANNVDIGALPLLGFESYGAGNVSFVNNTGNAACGTSTGACSTGNSLHVLGNFGHDIAQTNGGGCPPFGGVTFSNHGRSMTDAIVDGNFFDHYGDTTLGSCSVAQWIYLATPGGIVRNNVVLRSAGGGIQYYDAARLATISNNTVLKNRFGVILYGSNNATAGLNTVINNIIGNNTSAGIYEGFSSNQVCTAGGSNNSYIHNNLLFGNGADFNQAVAGCESRAGNVSENLTTTTLVSNTGDATGNYHIKSGSIAIGGGIITGQAGGTTPFAPSFDIAGATRNNTNPTLGAFEFGGVVGVPHVNPAGGSTTDFGQLNVGSSTAPVTFTFTNSGPSPVSNLFVSGSDDTDFTRNVNNNTCYQATVNPGGSCSWQYSFTPQSAASFTSTVSLTGTGLTTITMTLKGVGVNPVFPAFNPPSFDFGSVTIGSFKEKVIQAGNTPLGVALTSVSFGTSGAGNAAYSIISTTTTGDGSGLPGSACDGTMPTNGAKANCYVKLRCTPTAATTYVASLNMSSSSTQNPTAALSCTGVAAPAGGSPQTHDVNFTEPLQQINASWVNGIAPGYWPRGAGTGLTVNVGPGFVMCDGTPTGYSGGTLTMTNSTTNYIYLDHSSSCAPTVSTSAPGCSDVTIATVVAAGGNLASITDTRTPFKYCSAGAVSGLSVTAGKTLTVTNSVTLSGTDGSTVNYGAGGVIEYEVAQGTSALGTSSISAGSCATVVTTTATGAATTDNVQATFNADPTSTTGYNPGGAGPLTIYAYPTSGNVNFKVCNWTSGAITPGAVTLNWRVLR